MASVMGAKAEQLMAEVGEERMGYGFEPRRE